MTAPLHDVRVVLAAKGRAARLLARLLGDQGAQLVIPRRETASMGLDAFLDRGAWRIAGQDLAPLMPRADVHICDGETPAPSGPPGLISVHLPSVETGHPLAGSVLSDAAVASLCGLHHDPVGATPRYTGFAIPSVLTALYAANGTVAALLSRGRDGRGQRVVVTAQHAALQAQELVAAMSVSPGTHWPGVQWAASPWVRLYAAGCGRFVYLHAGLPAHLERLLEVLPSLGPSPSVESLLDAVSAQTRKDPTQTATPAEALLIARHLGAVLGQRPAQYWESELGSRGVCCVMVRSLGEWVNHAQARESGAVTTANGRVQPGLQVEVAGATPHGVGAAQDVSLEDVLQRWPLQSRTALPVDARPPLAGLRVLDCSQIIAGPVAARMLWELGADVMRVENPRLQVGFASAFHALFNAGKDSVMGDVRDASVHSALWKALESAPPDVMVGNWRDGVAQRLGLDADTLRKLNPRMVDVRVTAYGTRGPWAHWPGWEQTAQAAAGMQWAHGGERRPELFPAAVNDLATGLFASMGALCALYQGGSGSVTSSLSATATLMQMDEVCGAAPVPARKQSLNALEGFYRTANGWALLTVPPDGKARLQRVGGLWGFPLSGTDDEQRRWLQPRLRACSVDEWRARFRRAGVGATLVEWVGLSAAVKAAMATEKAWRAPMWNGGAVTLLRGPLEMRGTPVRHTPAPLPRGYANATLGWPVPSVEKRMSLRRWLRIQVGFGVALLRQRF